MMLSEADAPVGRKPQRVSLALCRRPGLWSGSALTHGESWDRARPRLDLSISACQAVGPASVQGLPEPQVSGGP